MFLSDRDIKQALAAGEVIIKDFDPDRLQPASYDVLLGNEFMLFDKHTMNVIDPKKPTDSHMRRITIPDGEAFVLHPGEFALAVTRDYFGVGPQYCCHIMGKSSLARLGLIIHTTAGFVDPGNELNATLELFNTNSLPVKLYPGMKIAQIAFCQLVTPAERPYGHKALGSKYHKATGIQSSEMWKNFKSEQPNQEKG
jgi:dCTP deaminase